MQVLEAFDNRRWLVARETSHLPEPAAHKEPIKVEVRGLRNKGVVSPGRTIAVHTKDGALAVPGDGFALVERPEEGHTYRVQADRRARDRHAAWREIPIPKGPRYAAADPDRPRAAAAATSPTPSPRLATEHAENPAGDRLGPPLPPLLPPLARASNPSSPWSGGWRTTCSARTATATRPTSPPPDNEPLLEFLFHTHAGYCQHFAGAAALLLRVAGVPTRVVVGFATGEQVGPHTWAVRDEDAHAWIEVYFPGVGWVPFNPTPASRPRRRLPRPRRPPGRAPGSRPKGGAGLLELARRRRRPLAPGPRRRPPGPPPARPAHPARRAPGAARAPALAAPAPPCAASIPTLTEIGPATADLALVAERARFAADDRPRSSPRPGGLARPDRRRRPGSGAGTDAEPRLLAVLAPTGRRRPRPTWRSKLDASTKGRTHE